jgi:hypothetical protein
LAKSNRLTLPLRVRSLSIWQGMPGFKKILAN